MTIRARTLDASYDRTLSVLIDCICVADNDIIASKLGELVCKEKIITRDNILG